MVGLPFFVVATSAPLLQKWFADTGHSAGKDPYFLYGASNLGSMLALVLYPLVVEPLFPIGERFGEQAWLWTVGYALLVLLIGGCVAFVWNAPTPQLQLAGVAAPTAEPSSLTVGDTAVQPVRRPGRRGMTWKSVQPAPAEVMPATSHSLPLNRRLRWLALSAIPSSLMLGVTTHLTTDVAGIPLFWVIPLALYLLTFILVFSRWPVVWTGKPHAAVLYVQPYVLVIVVMYLLQGPFPVWVAFLFHVLLFFLTALMCHGELAKDRPGTQHLTEFYLWLSLGGVLGGTFNALVAPLIFRTSSIEYPLAMICAYLFRPRLIGKYQLIPGDTNAYEATRLGRILDLAIPALMGLWTYLIYTTIYKIHYFLLARTFNLWITEIDVSLADLFKALTAVLILGMFVRPLRFALSLAAFAGVTLFFEHSAHGYVFQDRDFYGFVRVRAQDRSEEGEADYLALIHGDIDHGMAIATRHGAGIRSRIFIPWGAWARSLIGSIGLAARATAFPGPITAWPPRWSAWEHCRSIPLGP